MSRGAMLIRSSAVKVLNLFLSLVIAFYMMPFLVQTLGDRMYGLWALVGSVLGYYGLMDLGLSTAISRYLSRAVGQENAEEFKKVSSTSFYLFLGLGVITALLTLALAFSLNYFVESPADRRLFQFLLILLGFNFSFDFPVRPFNAVFSSNLREDISIGISIVKTLLTTLFIVAALKMGYGILGLAVVSVFFSVADSLTRVFVAFRIEPNMTISPRYFDGASVRSLFSYSAYSFIAKIADVLRFQIDNLVITAFVNLATVTHYTIAVRLVDYLAKLISQSMGTIGTVFSQDEGRNDYEAIRKKFLFLTKISLYIAMFFGCMAIIYGRAFVQRWMGAEYLDAYPVMVILFASYIILLMQSPLGPMLYGISKHKFFAYTNIADGFANFFLSILFVQRYGMFGVALGTAIPMVVNGVVRPWYACRCIDLSVSIYVSQVLTDSALALGLLAAGLLVCMPLNEPAYGSIALAVAVQTAIYWPAVIFWGFKKEQRDTVLNAGKKAFAFLLPQAANPA